MLDVACHKCDRRGRLCLEGVIAAHGIDTGLAAMGHLGRRLSAREAPSAPKKGSRAMRIMICPLTAVAASAAILWSSIALGEDPRSSTVTGPSLLGACEAQDALQQAYCRGYIGGIVDAVVASGRRSPVTACIPPSVSRDQIIAISIEYLRDHPRETRSYAGAVLILEAIRKAYRCR